MQSAELKSALKTRKQFNSALGTQHSALRRRGMTLLELAVILSIVAVLVYITLPTLRPQGDEAAIEFAKEQLRYLHARQQEYFALHGTYAPLSMLAKDKELGSRFDQRFAQDESEVNGVKFIGPRAEGPTYEIAAILPRESGRYRIDQTGQISAY